MQVNTYANPLSTNSDLYHEHANLLDVLRGLHCCLTVGSNMTPLAAGIVCEALRYVHNDAKILFSTFEEGCSWLSGHRHSQASVDFFADMLLTMLDSGVFYDSLFLSQDELYSLFPEDGCKTNSWMSRMWMEAGAVSDLLMKDVSWLTMQVHGCLWARFPIQDSRAPYTELCLNLEAGRNGCSPNWTGLLPHFLGISARV